MGDVNGRNVAGTHSYDGGARGDAAYYVYRRFKTIVQL
jgi:hypothetical protein